MYFRWAPDKYGDLPDQCNLDPFCRSHCEFIELWFAYIRAYFIENLEFIRRYYNERKIYFEHDYLRRPTTTRTKFGSSKTRKLYGDNIRGEEKTKDKLNACYIIYFKKVSTVIDRGKVPRKPVPENVEPPSVSLSDPFETANGYQLGSKYPTANEPSEDSPETESTEKSADSLLTQDPERAKVDSLSEVPENNGTLIQIETFTSDISINDYHSGHSTSSFPTGSRISIESISSQESQIPLEGFPHTVDFDSFNDTCLTIRGDYADTQLLSSIPALPSNLESTKKYSASDNLKHPMYIIPHDDEKKDDEETIKRINR
ncbi:STP1 protein [Plasmodium brasilianum]|uniref:STP1 protein n=1 Tax=Plasmodium brasilianum TaxID=5824 RepID=A0ACB9YDK9_PLABR|nr:STP1 protein [Plasmodium brasilianum]